MGIPINKLDIALYIFSCSLVSLNNVFIYFQCRGLTKLLLNLFLGILCNVCKISKILFLPCYSLVYKNTVNIGLLILYHAILLNSLTSNFFFCNSLEYSIYMLTLLSNKFYFFLSNLYAFFSCHTALRPQLQCWTEVMTADSSFILDLWWNTLTIKCKVSCRFFLDVLS